MLRFLGFITVVGIAFACGIYVGLQGPEAVLTKVRQLGAEVVAKTASAEHDLTVRMSLVSAKERLVQAKSDLLDKNYGKAETGLGEAAQNLSQAKAAAGQDLQKRLEGLLAKVSEVTTEVKAVKPGVQVKLEDAAKELDALLKR